FFSSRRRHTRSKRDWSSDVCSSDLTSKEYDLHVNNGRVLEHFHEGNMTYKSEGLTHELPSTFVEIAPELAKERGVKEGATVKLRSEERRVGKEWRSGGTRDT